MKKFNDSISVAILEAYEQILLLVAVLLGNKQTMSTSCSIQQLVF